VSTAAELAHLFRALKAPAAARALPKLAERARAEEWTYERFAEALLGTERSSREAHGGEARIRVARFPGRKSLEEFDWSFQRSLKKEVALHLAQLDFLLCKENVVLLGPPGTGKTHLAIALGVRACLAGHHTAFATATEWVARLLDAQRLGRVSAELRRLGRVPLVIVDEVGLCADRRTTGSGHVCGGGRRPAWERELPSDLDLVRRQPLANLLSMLARMPADEELLLQFVVREPRRTRSLMSSYRSSPWRAVKARTPESFRITTSGARWRRLDEVPPDFRH
jgi:hypothetical protein